jgi:hypothetical protein
VRNALLLVVLVTLSCSSKKEGDKQSPAGGSAPAAAPDLGNVKNEVKGSLELTGPFPGTYTWKPDMSVLCGCSVSEKKGKADFTMSDAAGRTFISATIQYDGAIEVRTASGPGGLTATLAGTGAAVTCAGEYAPSSWHIVIDAPVKGSKGESGQVKGTLDIGCP